MLDRFRQFLINGVRVLMEGAAPVVGSVLCVVFTVNAFGPAPVDSTGAIIALSVAAAAGVAGAVITMRRIYDERTINLDAQIYKNKLELLVTHQKEDIIHLKNQILVLNQAVLINEPKNTVASLQFGRKTFSSSDELMASIFKKFVKANNFKPRSDTSIDLDKEIHPLRIHRINYFLRAFTEFMGGAGIVLFPAMTKNLFVGPISLFSINAVLITATVVGGLTTVAMEFVLFDKNKELAQLDADIIGLQETAKKQSATIVKLVNGCLTSKQQLRQLIPTLPSMAETDSSQVIVEPVHVEVNIDDPDVTETSRLLPSPSRKAINY